VSPAVTTAKEHNRASLNYKRAARRNKIRAASYRKRLRQLAKFEVKLKSKVLGDDTINFCLAQLRKRNVKLKERRYTIDEKISSLAFSKQSGRAYSKLRNFV
jgi:hypothetical protein